MLHDGPLHPHSRAAGRWLISVGGGVEKTRLRQNSRAQTTLMAVVPFLPIRQWG